MAVYKHKTTEVLGLHYHRDSAFECHWIDGTKISEITKVEMLICINAWQMLLLRNSFYSLNRLEKLGV